jgi:hypothetical protein
MVAPESRGSFACFLVPRKSPLIVLPGGQSLEDLPARSTHADHASFALVSTL